MATNKNLLLFHVDTETGGFDGPVFLSDDSDKCMRDEHGWPILGQNYYGLYEIAVAATLPSGESLGEFNVNIRPSGFAVSDEALAMHKASGRWEMYLNGHTIKEARTMLLEWMDSIEQLAYNENYFPEGEPITWVPHGNNVKFDLNFLFAKMPELSRILYYRAIDSSTVDMMIQANHPTTTRFFEKKYAHTAIEDVYESLGEYKLNVGLLMCGANHCEKERYMLSEGFPIKEHHQATLLDDYLANDAGAKGYRALAKRWKPRLQGFFRLLPGRMGK